MVDIGREPSSRDTGCKQTLHMFNDVPVAALPRTALASARNEMADDVTAFAFLPARWCRRALGSTTILATAMLCGCVAAPPPGPSILALPGSTRSPAQFQADDARCRSSAASQAGLPANVAASDPTAGVLSASQAAQERYNASYAGCMTAAGDQVPAAQAPGIDTTVNPYAYGGYGNAANVPVTTSIETGPVYAGYSGWGWGWGWDGWYGGFAPAYAYGSYGYAPWIPFGLSIGWGWGPGWGYGGWGYRGWGRPGWSRPG